MDNQAAKQQIKSTPLLREAVHESETSPALNSMSLRMGFPSGSFDHRRMPSIGVSVGMEAGCSPLSDTLRMLRNEVETPNFCNQIVVRNLLSSLFVYFMRDWVDAVSPAANDWFSAVRSPHLARALAQMHEAPERAWTLEELAQEAGLSRAAFARIFSASVGEPPHSYLTRCAWVLPHSC